MQGLRKKQGNKDNKRRKKVLKSKRYENLKVCIRDNSGNHSTYDIPVIPANIIKRRGFNKKIECQVVLQQDFSKPNTWKIVNDKTNIIVPSKLVNEKISIKKGNLCVEGIVVSAQPSGKGPEGGSVPVPPQPLD